MLVQGAHDIISRDEPDTDLKRWGLRLAERGGKRGKKKAVVAVARKLGILLHRLGESDNFISCRKAKTDRGMKPPRFVFEPPD
jgi:hypothetical protein